MVSGDGLELAKCAVTTTRELPVKTQELVPPHPLPNQPPRIERLYGMANRVTTVTAGIGRRTAPAETTVDARRVTHHSAPSGAVCSNLHSEPSANTGRGGTAQASSE